jgi:hydrogenase/urease accessory protein HupE
MIAVQTKVKIAIGLAIAFIALNIVDILLTWQGLQLGAIELNFFMNSVLSLGFFSSVAFKLGIASGIAAIMLHRGQFATLIIGVSLLSFVCIRNGMVIGHLS